jgi:hypothetical protein
MLLFYFFLEVANAFFTNYRVKRLPLLKKLQRKVLI